MEILEIKRFSFMKNERKHELRCDKYGCVCAEKRYLNNYNLSQKRITLTTSKNNLKCIKVGNEYRFYHCFNLFIQTGYEPVNILLNGDRLTWEHGENGRYSTELFILLD